MNPAHAHKASKHKLHPAHFTPEPPVRTPRPPKSPGIRKPATRSPAHFIPEKPQKTPNRRVEVKRAEKRSAKKPEATANKPTGAESKKKLSLFRNSVVARRSPLVCRLASILDWPKEVTARGAGGEDALIMPDNAHAEYRAQRGYITFQVRFNSGTLFVSLSTSSFGTREPCEARLNLAATGSIDAARAEAHAREVSLWAQRLVEIETCLVSISNVEIEIDEAVAIWRERGHK